MPEGDRYINVPAQRLLAELRAIGAAVTGRGGRVTENTSGAEVVFDFAPPNQRAYVRVYTSLGIGRLAVRECGRDAVRIVVGASPDDRPGLFRLLGDKKRIYRTAPKGEHDARVSAFLERLKAAIREGYRQALHTPVCPACGHPMAIRKNKKDGNKFYGCTEFPQCKGTRPFTNGRREA